MLFQVAFELISSGKKNMLLKLIIMALIRLLNQQLLL
jgi:hypothetical protein